MSYSDIARWQARIRAIRSLIAQLRNIISSCDSLANSLSRVQNCTKEVIVNGEEYDKGKLAESIKVLNNTKSQCSSIILACNKKIVELENMIAAERRRLENQNKNNNVVEQQ